MMVRVEALQPFVTILDGGVVVSGYRGETISVPKDRADKLVAAGLARFPEPKAAPETKDAGPAKVVAPKPDAKPKGKAPESKA